ncbi:hypothetical protein BJ912DRAFT_1065147 [Pholiota molesta]|nr:hypothetical protein BJ912DRAFT_1065147 [Pholiota molesta]
MAFADPLREGMGMRQPYTHTVSIQEWTSDVYEGASYTQSDSTPFFAPSQHEVLQRVKTTSKPLRSSPLAGPALSGDRTSIPTEPTSAPPSGASTSRSLRSRSILLTEPLSCFLRSKSSQSWAQPSSQEFPSSSLRPPSTVPPVHLSPSQLPSIDQDQRSARYRPSAIHPPASDASTSSTTINNPTSPSASHNGPLMIDTSHSAIARPPTVITSPTECTFRPHRATIYTPPNSGSRPPSAQPHTPPPPQSRSRLRLGARTTLDARGRASAPASATAAPASRSPSAPLSPSPPPAIRAPPPTRPKSILKNPSAARRPSTSPLAETQPAATAAARSPAKDNSWYVNSPYTITPPFTRLGLNAPGVVLPLTVKEYRRRTAMAALTGGGVGAGARDAAKGRMGRSTSACMDDMTSGIKSSLRGDRRTASASASLTSMTHDATQRQRASGGSRTEGEAVSAGLPENAKSNDAHVASTISSAAPSQPDTQPHWLTLPPYSQSQQHAEYALEPGPSWTRAQSQSSAASSVSSLPLTLPSSVPDSSLPSQTPSVRSATETSSVCTSVTGTGMDDKSEETALPHGAHVDARTPVPPMVDIPALTLKRKRKSVLATMRSFCWTGTGPAADADVHRPGRVQHGSTNIVDLPLPVAAMAAPAERRTKTRRSLPLMNKLDWNHAAATVPIAKPDATSSAVEKKSGLHVPAAAVALAPAAEPPTPGDGHLQRGANRSGGEKKLKDAGVEVEVRYIDVGIVSDAGLRKSQAAITGQRRSGSARKVWDSLRGGGRRRPQAMA